MTIVILLLYLKQASTSEQSESTLVAATDHVTSKQKKHKGKRKLNDSGLESDEVHVKHKKKHKPTPALGQQQQFSDSHNDSVLSNTEDEFYKRKHKNKKYKN